MVMIIQWWSFIDGHLLMIIIVVMIIQWWPFSDGRSVTVV